MNKANGLWINRALPELVQSNLQQAGWQVYVVSREDSLLPNDTLRRVYEYLILSHRNVMFFGILVIWRYGNRPEERNVKPSTECGVIDEKCFKVCRIGSEGDKCLSHGTWVAMMPVCLSFVLPSL